jgi:hypothetical protein
MMMTPSIEATTTQVLAPAAGEAPGTAPGACLDVSSRQEAHGYSAADRNEALRRAAARQAELRATGELEHLDPLERARRNPRSLSLAVKARCWDCVGAGADPNPRGEIRDCRATACPLHPARPYQSTGGHRHLRAAINAKCQRCMGPDPGVARRIRECDIAGCPLWPVRPYQHSREDA